MSSESIWSAENGQQILSAVEVLARESADDAVTTALRARKKLSNIEPDLIRRAVEIIFTRRQAATMGIWTEKGLFTREALEQASDPRIAARHASRFQGCKHLLEIGTGIGIDTAALARVAGHVTTIEQKENLAEMARHNLKAQGITNVEVIVGDAIKIVPEFSSSKFDGLWTDPARRDKSGKRLYDPKDWSPPLSFVLNLQIAGPRGVKISPGTNLPASKEVSREWLGLERECLEQTLWAGTPVVDSTVYLADENFEWIPNSQVPNEAVVSPPFGLESQWLVEPHAALIRSSYLAGFFREREIAVLDPQIAYGIARNAPPPHSLYERFKIIETFPYNLARLNERITAKRWNSRTEIKKRGFSESTDELRHKLKLLPSQEKQSDYGVVFVTRVADEHYCILAERA